MKIRILVETFLVIAGTFIVTSVLQASALTDVAEIIGYKQIYQLDIPDNAALDVNPVPYSVNNSGTLIPGGIIRIGYYLELANSESRQWVWVSMDAFTQDLTKIGVPTLASGAVWQMKIKNMNVESNVASIITGTGMATGNIEFWPYNYMPNVTLPNIGGNSGLFDFNDLNEGVMNYGSMQIHNFAVGQTLLAYNDWGGSPTLPVDDIGIGNNTAANTYDGNIHPDWTWLQNADSFTLKSLEVWVQPVALTANAGPDKIICNQICDKAVLDGRKSQGKIVSFDWQLDLDDDRCDNTASGVTPTVTDLCPGTYTVTLIVTDDDELTDTDEMNLTVLEICDTCAIMQGDFDSDGDVDGDDLRIFSGHFGADPLLTP